MGLSLSLVTEDKEIPGIKQKPALLPFSSFTGSCILFDLETSSLKLDSEILQIAALYTVSGDKFDTYIQPNKSIAPSSSAVTGLTANGNILFYNGKPVHAYNAHNAVNDVNSLHKLMTLFKVEKQDVLEFSFSVESIVENMKYDKIVKVDAESFGDLVKGKYMSAQMAVRCAQSGLKKCHLDLAFHRKGFQGLLDLLSQRRQDGSPRVTKTAAVIKKITGYYDK
ncbi:unnamed protein product [Mytilus coruscus]|uniref:PML C-terminal domain-containing protein n=1 Tax=Mytilus coruscus TaxID=42192 RepID=A0A6J8EQ96_MYTCO|nr:unnamed protein product [Mytilus coruscus]